MRVMLEPEGHGSHLKTPLTTGFRVYEQIEGLALSRLRQMKTGTYCSLLNEI